MDCQNISNLGRAIIYYQWNCANDIGSILVISDIHNSMIFYDGAENERENSKNDEVKMRSRKNKKKKKKFKNFFSF